MARLGHCALLLCAASYLSAAPARGQDASRTEPPSPTPAAPLPSTIVIDASDFLDEIPSGHTLTNAAALGVPWLFNNTALELRTRSNYVKRIEIAEPGTYHLHIRSHGSDASTLRVAIGDRIIEHDAGNEPLIFKNAGRFELDAGIVDVRLTRIERAPVFDVLVLTQAQAFSEEALRSLELPDDVVVLKQYTIPRASAVKFGDLTGDGRTDFVVLTRDYSAIAFDHGGRELWSYRAPATGARARGEFEAPGLVWDFDQDGFAEVVHWRMKDQTEWLVIADGRTGEVERRTPWPTQALPHDYSNFRLAIADLDGNGPTDVLVLTDSGIYSERQPRISVTAYDASLEVRWQHEEQRLKDHLGHYVYPIDLTGDGKDEVIVSGLALDPDGRPLWNRFDLFYDNHDHADSYRFADVTGDGRPELISAHSEIGVVAMDALTGAMVWQNTAEHAQQVEVGRFLDGAAAPHVAIGARTYGDPETDEPRLWAQVHWFDADGRLVRKWPANPLNGNPVFVKGDWRGDGTEALFWYKFRLDADGTGTLHFREPVYHMFDFTGNGADDVITLEGGRLVVYGYRHAGEGKSPLTSNASYRKNKVANHTHY